jgi:hypothetical protein
MPGGERAFRYSGSLEGALAAVSDTYGCLWSLGGSGAILVRKAFKTADQTPQIVLEDALAVANDMFTTLSRFGEEPRIPGMGPPLKALFASLSPAQLDAIERQEGRPARETLYVRDLSPQQQELVRRSMFHVVLAPHYRAWEPLASKLNARESLEVTRGQGPDGALLALAPSAMYVRWAGSRGARTANLLTTSVADATPTWIPENLRPKFEEPASPKSARPDNGKVPVLPEALRTVAVRHVEGLTREVELPLGEVELAAVCRRLSEASGLRITAAPHLANHRMTLEPPVMKVAQAIWMVAEAGGWQHAPHEGGFQFRRPVVPMRSGLLDTPRAVHAALPRDYRDYLWLDPYPSVLRISSDTKMGGSPGLLRLEYTRRLGERMNTAAQAAAEAYLECVQEKMEEKGRVAYTEMSARERHLLLQTLVLDALRMVQYGSAYEFLTGRLPAYAEDFDRAEIRFDGSSFNVGIQWAPGRWLGYGIGASRERHP